MLDFLTKFFRREEASKNLAKERLRLVLMSDRVSLAPATFDSMKGEMLSVVRRYLDIDEQAMDMHFENAERQFMLLANIPVLKVKTFGEIAIAPPTNGSNGDAVLRDHAADEILKPRRRRRRRRSAKKKPDGSNGAASDDVITDF